MARVRRITSATHNIIFNEDAAATSASVGYSCRKNTPLDLGRPQDGSEVGSLRNIPSSDIESYIRRRGFSLIKIPFNMIETTHPLLEDLWHDLSETLEDAALFIETRGGRGAQAVFEYKTNGAAAISYKTIFYGWVDEKGARGYEDSVECFQLMNMELNLVCEPAWRPSTAAPLAEANPATIYNHKDVGHTNLIDIAGASIAGDLDALVRLRVEFHAGTVATHTKLVRVARRTRGDPTQLAYWLEAEDSLENAWHDGIERTCSEGIAPNGEAIHGAGSLAGDLQWTVAAPSTDDYGRFAVYARLKATNITTTKFRISSYFDALGLGWIYNDWYWLPVANIWQLLYLGDICWNPTLRSTAQVDTLLLKLEYVKIDGTTVECDYAWLVPVDESVMEITVPNLLRTCLVDEFFVSSDVDTFEYTALEKAGAILIVPGVRHSQLKLKPGKLNRLYFYMDSYISPNNVSEVATGAHVLPLTMKVTIDYLPQYISPLE